MKNRMAIALLDKVVNLLSDGPMSASDISIKCYGNTRAIGAVRKAIFTLIEYGTIIREGEPAKDSYKLVEKSIV